jgi:group II intron reverse transcriptase/maturase
MMNGYGKSDRLVLPKKSLNNTEQIMTVAEGMEGSSLTKGKPKQSNTCRTQCRESVHSRLNRIRQAAKRNKKVKFTALMHHVYQPDLLRESYFNLKRDAVPGIDGQTWKEYREDLDISLQGLAERLKRGAYRARPARRAYIPKADGRQRPLGVPVLEDKIVQRAAVEVMDAIYETDFLGFSYGFRPKRNQHNALDALSVGLTTRKVSWVLDADIRGFFDAVDHGWMMKFIEHRIADRRLIRLIRKWLKAGVLEEGKWAHTEEGTPQGSSVSPLLANIYLHYVFDLWVKWWRQTQAQGDMIVVRFADDFIAGFRYKADAEEFLVQLRERFAKFALELHPEKTRLLEFGRCAIEFRQRRGKGKPETFEFLGFTHICGKTRKGTFTVLRHTSRKRLQAKLKEVKIELRKRLHDPIPNVGKWLRSVVGGHMRYYGVPTNCKAIETFRWRVALLWHRSLSRRSQKGGMPLERMKRYIDQWLPATHIYHPWPLVRLGVITRGKSPVR